MSGKNKAELCTEAGANMRKAAVTVQCCSLIISGAKFSRHNPVQLTLLFINFEHTQPVANKLSEHQAASSQSCCVEAL